MARPNPGRRKTARLPVARTSAPPSRRPDWSPSLAGLRGLAILLVLLFHMGVPMPNGGPVGVTVFFVLSGYLITRILLGELRRTDRVDLARFYVRRLRRLVPALLMVVAAVLVVATAVGGAGAVIPDSVLTLTYLSNWARASGQGMGLWNHAWSLGIEAQFYIVWPVALMAITRRIGHRPWRAALLLLGMAGLSAGLRLAMSAAGASPDRLYFGTDTRSEALLVGCALAFIEGDWRFRALPRWVGPASLVAILVFAVSHGMDLLWSGSAYTGVAVASALLILTLRHGESPLGLSSQPMTWLGDRSYSLYLWHVPVLMLLGADAGAGWWTNLLPVAISVGLAALSYRYVERPFLVRRRPHDAVVGMLVAELPDSREERRALPEAA